MAASRRFNSSARTLWLVAGIVAVVVGAALGARALAQRGDDSRDEVARYIVAINHVQGTMAGELARLNRAYAGFRAAPAARPRQVAELREAERTLADLARQIRALHVPDEAAKLHEQLLRLLALQSDFAGELTQLAEYLPRLGETTRELTPAGERVRRELAAAKTPAAQARAFARYSVALDRVANKLARLSAPPVLEPARRAEIARLRRLATLGRQLQAAIEEQRVGDVRRLSDELARLAAIRGATRAERDAVIAYNERLQAIGAQRNALERERRRLDRELA